MPAEDRYHKTVIRALERERWKVVDEQITLTIGERNLWIDLKAQKESELRSILVEVKAFESMRSPIDYLADAVGKYVLYQTALEYIRDESPLYLAVTQTGYNGILSEPIGQNLIKKLGIRLLVFAPELGEIVLWTV